MNKLTAFILVAALSACSTPIDIRKEYRKTIKPTLELTSIHKAHPVAECIYDRWMKSHDAYWFSVHHLVTFIESDADGGYTVKVVYGNGPDASFLAYVSDTPNGSKTRYFLEKNFPAFWRISGLEKGVKECQYAEPPPDWRANMRKEIQ